MSRPEPARAIRPAAPLTPPAEPATVDSLAPGDFDRLACHIRATCGIQMPPSKRIMLEGRLRRRMRARSIATFADYCAWLFAAGNLAAETPHLINAVTTNKTDFFREPNHFAYLRDHILPALAAAGQRRLRAWSAGCSTGAEAYTLAMVLDSFAREAGGPDFGILATDIDTDVLAYARRGVYDNDLLAPVPRVLRDRYVLAPRDAARGQSRIAPDLRAAIGFAQLNFMDRAYPVGAPMDLIFCRNVLIYFDKARQGEVIGRLVDCLKPGGHLFLGHSESVADSSLPLTLVATTIYRRS